jgi:two-component system, cell cycle sensor histidine kinase and response regulator CckA
MTTDRQSWDVTRLSRYSLFFKLLPFLVLGFSLAATIFAWHQMRGSFRNRASIMFESRCAEIASRITRHLHAHESVLRGANGLFNAKGEVRREDWRTYVTSLQLEQEHPGILGVGFAKWMTPSEMDEATRQIRAAGFPEFVVWPAGQRPAYTSIIFLGPFTWRNQRAFGYDMYSEPIRREAMDQAINTGFTTISPRITLVQETEVAKQNGILMYVPVYHLGMPVDSEENRKKALRGFCYSPIRMNDFVFGALGQLPDDIGFELIDGDSVQREKRLFSSFEASKSDLPPGFQADFSTLRIVDVFGRTWTFCFFSLPPFANELNTFTVNLSLFGGIALSLMLSGITFTLLATREKALVLACAMTQELRDNEKVLRTSREHLEAILSASPAGVFETDGEGKYVFVSSRWQGALGTRPGSLHFR